MMGVLGRGLRGLVLVWGVLVALVGLMTGLGGLSPSPQLTYGVQRTVYDPQSSRIAVVDFALMSYDLRTGRSATLVGRLPSLPVAWRWSPSGGVLAYVLLRPETNDYEVWLFWPRTRQQVRLTEGLPFGAPPQWSPDERQVALVSRNQDICLYDVQGQAAPDCLNVQPAGLPSWAADGRTIAYVSRLPDGGLYRVDAQTRQVTPILQGARFVGGLVWSPDGQTLAYSRQDAPGAARRIYVIGRDESAPRQLTDGANSQDQPSWSPDGAQIAYNEYVVADRMPDARAVRVADGQTTLISGLDFAIDADPQWSPDGAWVAFVTDRFDGLPRLMVVPSPREGQPTPSPTDDGVRIHLYVHDWRP